MVPENEPKILVAFVGLGPKKPGPGYDEAAYRLGDRTSKPTELVQAALDEIVGGFDRVHLLGTDDVERAWGDRLRAAMVRPFEWHTVPRGRDERELWEIFKELLRILEGLTDGTQLYVDVTHGFRVQPMIALAALSFWQSELARQNKKAPALHITYGAYDARADGVAPIWDLTEILTVARYNAAIDALIRYGRADDLQALADARGRADRKRAHQAGDMARRDLGAYLVRLGKAARAYADDLALARLPHLTSADGSAAELGKLLANERARSLVEALPVLENTLRSLGEAVRPLVACSGLFAEGSFGAWAALAKTYGRVQRFAEQAVVLREGAVTRWGHAVGADMPEPGQSGATKARKALEHALNVAIRDAKDANDPKRAKPIDSADNVQLVSPQALLREGVREIIELARNIQEVRNDIQHGGLNNQPLAADDLRDRLENLSAQFCRLAEAPPVRLDGLARAACGLANLTNHPLSSWSEAQVAAARALGHGDPFDLDGGMPEVPPDADSTQVQAIADELASRVRNRAAAAAVVQTEHVLSFALVRVLQSVGVRCYAATTARDVLEERSEDGGATVQRRTFRFERFREYPGEPRA